MSDEEIPSARVPADSQIWPQEARIQFRACARHNCPFPPSTQLRSASPNLPRLCVLYHYSHCSHSSIELINHLDTDLNLPTCSRLIFEQYAPESINDLSSPTYELEARRPHIQPSKDVITHEARTPATSLEMRREMLIEDKTVIEAKASQDKDKLSDVDLTEHSSPSSPSPSSSTRTSMPRTDQWVRRKCEGA
jgi:hypothetical protein